MNMLLLLAMAATGFGIGALGGVLGIGGGILVVPALIYLFHFNYKQAVGTSLGMLLPPIGIFAFLTYWRAHEVDLRAAAVLAAAFAVGAMASSWVVTHVAVREDLLRRGFAFVLFYVAGSMLLQADPRAYAALRTVLLLLGLGAAYAGLRLLGRRWDRQFNAARIYRAAQRTRLQPDYEI
jgi:uncharacterized membrane protein YfcA